MVKSIFVSNSIMAPAARNGPNGIMWSLFFLTKISDSGNPISDPTNMDSMAIGNDKTMPNINSSFMSPPPIDSFLKIKSPSFFSVNININESVPFKMDIRTLLGPYIIPISNNIIIPKNINTLSGIII